MCKNAVVMFRNCSCPTCKPALAPQVRPLVPKEPTWFTVPSLTEMVICSDTLKLLSCAYIANTRHRQQDVHHPKCELWDRHLPQHPGKWQGWVQLGCPGLPWENSLDPQSTLGVTVTWVTRNPITSQPSYPCHPWSHRSTVLLFLSWHFLWIALPP